ncbi:MAG: tungsten formylmethanofuran dehydrogenase [Chitinophagaceae bacterium]|nr:MAG: tungsten formylmethanofuran dehydrogenase [Chitinophagaceae bacterium]
MIAQDTALTAYRLMLSARTMAETYEANRDICRYVHSTSRGHEAIQIATGLQLLPCDYVSPYYRDDSMLLALGFTPYQLMLQLLAKRDDPFSGGRSYYSHPNYRGPDKPNIIHQSSATGMQAIPATGIAQGLKHLREHLPHRLQSGPAGQPPIVICSLGDASVTEGEVSEAFQFAVLRQLPIIFLVQDNNWGISVSSKESRAMDAYDYAAGFRGFRRVRVDGSDLALSFECLQRAAAAVREQSGPFLVQATVPLLNHHTSGVRKEFYRSPEDLVSQAGNDPIDKLEAWLKNAGTPVKQLEHIQQQVSAEIEDSFRRAVASPEPDISTVSHHVFAATPVKAESGTRVPADAKKVLMVDAALFAIREIMEEFEETILFGQDVGRRLGGVFREAATLAEKFGDHRVFNTAIQEAYIIGATAGLSATGIKPIVEVQFADYIYPGLNQLSTELAKSCYLTNGRFPVQTLIRVPVGAYGGGGPYHSTSIETLLLAIKGIKIVYPSNAADMKGLLKAAFLDPNPVIMLEHKGLYWSKVPGTEAARQPEPSRDYIVPLGVGRLVQEAGEEAIEQGRSCCIITYGLGVYLALEAATDTKEQVEIIDIRTLFPLDETLIYTSVEKHGKCMVLTEEQQTNSFAEALAGRISAACFNKLDAPVQIIGAMDLPAVPLNIALEQAMLPTSLYIGERITSLLLY